MILSKTKRFSSLASSSSSSASRSNQHSSLSLVTLLKRGFTPTLRDYNVFLSFLFQSQRFQFITHFISQLESNKIKGDYRTHSVFTRALLKQHKYEKAVEVINSQLGKSPSFRQYRVWDSIIQGFCVNAKDPERGFTVLQDFFRVDGNFVPSSFTFCLLIRSFCWQGKMNRAIEVLEAMSDERINYPFNNFVFSSVISGFVNIGKPELAVQFYENTAKSSALQPNVVTYTCLVSAYCRLGRVQQVFDLIGRIEKEGLAFDVVFYGSLMYECFREGMVLEALRKHKEMVERNLELDTISYTILIDGFSKEGNVEKAVGFLYKMKKDGIKPNVITYTAMVLGFCKRGKLTEASRMLKMAEDSGIEVDEFAYATLIDGLSRSRDFHGVFRLLDEMEKKGIRPSIVTYNTIINGLCKGGRMAEADEVSRGILGDVVTYSTLLHGYVEEEDAMGMLKTKRRIEEAGVCMDVVMCNILIKALFMVGSFEDAFAIYKGMPEMNLVANHVTYCTLIDGYCKFGQIDEALQIFDEFRRTTIASVACYNCIINGLCKKGIVDMAIQVFIELNEKRLPLDPGIYWMLHESIFKAKGPEGILDFILKIEILGHEVFDVICNNALCFLCDGGFSEFASDLYILMRRNASVVTITSYYSLLSLLLKDGKMWLTRIILSNFVKLGVIDPRVNKIILLYMCMKDADLAIKFLKIKNANIRSLTLPISVLEKLTKDGRAEDAFKLLMGSKDNLPTMDVVDYTIIVDGLCKGGHIGKAIELCSLAKENGITLSIVTYNSVINGLCQQGCFMEAFRLFDSLEKIDVIPSEITYAILIDTLSKEGYLLDARMLFDRMVFKGLKPNIRVYNSLINGYCKLGQLQEGLKLLTDLERVGLRADEFTVSAVVYGFCRNGDVEGAREYFFDSKEKGLLPDLLGFLYLIKGLCSKGRMEESRDILREMLQTESVLKLLDRVDTGVETESVEHFLVSLCQQGHIKGAITILDEVAAMFFPVGKKVDEKRFGIVESKSLIPGNERNMEMGTCKAEELDGVVCDDDNLPNISQTADFDSCYALLSSFCSKGDLRKANKLAKLLAGFQKG